MTKKKWIGLVLAFVLFVTILSVPHIDHLAVDGQRCLALFVAVFILYIFESIPAAVISIGIIPALVLLRIGNINEALTGFASASTYLVIGSFILAAAMIKTGLGKRITCRLLLLIGTSPVRISFGLMIVNMIMAFLIPSSTARTAMLLPICLAIIQEYQGTEKNKARYSSNILMTLCITSSTISAGILTSTVSNPMAVEYIQKAIGETVTYGKWFVWGFIPAFIMTVVSWGVIQIFFRVSDEGKNEDAEYLRSQLSEMGKLQFNEGFTAAVVAITVVFWILGEQLGIDSTTAAFLGAILLFMPRCNILDWKDCQRNISLSVVFVISGGISLGNAMVATGTSDWLAERVFGFLSPQMDMVWCIILIVVIVQFMHVFFVGTATMANAFFPILISVASQIYADPLAIIMPAAFMIGGYPVLMFFNTTPNILCYDTGFIRSSDFLKIGIPVSICACVVYAVCAKWYWPFIGMF